ncbi:hypothetical protein J2S37_001627 [Corynebacterium felinum]|uniref:Uncharacterized protein n=1 Tax=Corynebacterium felinum TaxID=131318 RepID=A0ABU2B8Y9_9CORY|nr:hypothetical protein [Corynebacterium felinum]
MSAVILIASMVLRELVHSKMRQDATLLLTRVKIVTDEAMGWC